MLFHKSSMYLFKPQRRLRMPASMRVIILTPVENCETGSIKVNFLSNTGLLFKKNLWNKFGDPGNDQLASLRYDFKRLTSITSRPNIALNAENFYSSRDLFNKSTFTSRIMTC